MTLRTTLLAALLLGAAGTTLADDAALLACRTLTESAARLACYDAIPAAARDQAFGLEQKKPEAPPTAVQSTIVGTFSGWGPSTLVTLANGQVWKIVDGSQADLQPVSNPPVRIVRNMFGTMFLEIDGTNASPKVRRIR
jgi:hypothetical protein